MYANEKIKESRDDACAEKPFKKCRHCITIDMGQNTGLPHVAPEQVGDTYYFSTLTIFTVAAVDNSRPNGRDTMKAYIWHECEAKRGANNIASCLLKDYKSKGFFAETQEG